MKLSDVTKAMPRRYEDDARIEPSKLHAAVCEYATRVASMVSTSVYYKEHAIPGTPTGETSNGGNNDNDNSGSDTDSVGPVDEREDDGFHARNGAPSTSVEGSDKVCTP